MVCTRFRVATRLQKVNSSGPVMVWRLRTELADQARPDSVRASRLVRDLHSGLNGLIYILSTSNASCLV